jgi:lipid-binding SYLF domain-containing protein
MRKAHYLLFLTFGAVLTAARADDTTERLGKATAVLNAMTKSGHDIRAGALGSADCVVVIPGFKKGALVVGVGHGRGFISCRNGGNWSAPGAITLDSGSLGVQIGGEEINIVILSLDPACVPSCFRIVSRSGPTLRQLGEMARRHMLIPTQRLFFTDTPREPSRAST